MRTKIKPKKRTIAVNVSLRGPITVSPDVWYYENKTYLDVYLSADFVRGNPTNGVNFHIPRRKLESSLKQMNAARKA